MDYYTREDIEYMVKNNEMLYQKSCVRFKGKTRSGQLYSEIIADMVLQQLKTGREKILCLNKADLRDDFSTSARRGATFAKSEEAFCKKLMGKEIKGLGKVIDYQINMIKHSKVNIDLLTFDEKNKTCTVVEARSTSDDDGDSEYCDTLLRHVLKVESMYRLLKEHESEFKKTHTDEKGQRDMTFLKDIKKGIYVPKDSVASKEYDEMLQGARPNLKKLYDFLKIEFRAF